MLETLKVLYSNKDIQVLVSDTSKTQYEDPKAIRVITVADSKQELRDWTYKATQESVDYILYYRGLGVYEPLRKSLKTYAKSLPAGSAKDYESSQPTELLI